MKVGILTFVNANNFGAVLQAYGSQHFLDNQGVDAELVNCQIPNRQMPMPSVKRSIPSKLAGLFYKLIKMKAILEGRAKRKAMADFRVTILNLSSAVDVNNIYERCSSYDRIIIGSDQVWNTDLNGDSKLFYLPELKEKKYTYAASVGRFPLTENDCKRILESAGTFDEISVREKALQDFLQGEGIAAKLVLDPVFLLDKKEWEKVVRLPKKQKYIFVYAMEYSSELEKVVAEAKKYFSLPVYIVWAGGRETAIDGVQRIFCADPREFLGWIHQADCVITNSFHGAAFSVIYKRNLLLVKHSTRNDRLAQLAEAVKMPNCLLDSVKYKECKIDKYIISGDTAYSNLGSMIVESREYLLSITAEAEM